MKAFWSTFWAILTAYVVIVNMPKIVKFFSTWTAYNWFLFIAGGIIIGGLVLVAMIAVEDHEYFEQIKPSNKLNNKSKAK